MRLRFIVSLEQAILEAVQTLPAEKQQEFLNHAARLRLEAGSKIPFKGVKGLWADLGISLSAEDIEENRRDMWRNFPREDL
jgi:hypothetical protein